NDFDLVQEVKTAEIKQDPAKQDGWVCRKCQTVNNPDFAFCQNCGTPKNDGNKKKISWPVILVIAALIIILAGGGYWFYTSSQAASGANIADQAAAEPEEYRASISLKVYSQPAAKGDSTDTIEKDKYVTVTETKKSGNEVWGKVTGGWILLEDGKGEYAEEIKLETTDPESGESTSTAAVPSYKEPSLSSESLGDIAPNTKVTFKEGKKDQFGTVWYKTADGKWVIFKDGSKTYFQKVELKKEETSKQTTTTTTPNTSTTTPNTSSSSSSSSNTGATGTYRCLYGMNVRESASKSSRVIAGRAENALVNIVRIVNNSDGSRWGELDSGGWICIFESHMTYLQKT
ncbi:MAG: zinc ribbon domain-containing protein, partial [Erysipelotrichaceae bacterium]|nr:zinc ribbon domain-containing protein [Erysipelotrichaceae bacterium]